LHTTLQAAGVDFRIVEARAGLRDILRAEGLEEHVGYFGRRGSIADAITEFQDKKGIGLSAEARRA
jgi:hypothetical protein